MEAKPTVHCDFFQASMISSISEILPEIPFGQYEHMDQYCKYSTVHNMYRVKIPSSSLTPYHHFSRRLGPIQGL